MQILAILFIIAYVLPVCVIAGLQIQHIKKHNQAIILSPDDFKIAREYALTTQYLHIIETIFGGILFVFWIFCGFGIIYSISAVESEFLSQLLFVLLFLILNFVLSLPLGAYKMLVIDKSFGFTKSTSTLYIKDTLKSFAMLIIIATLLCSALIWVIANVALWWVVGFAIVLIVAIIANVIYPTIIAPMFNTFTPLHDENLKEQIESIMEKVGFRANGIFVIDASKRDGRLNAYFGGLGSAKRVVIFDTLLQKVSPNELLAILGHELGHFKHKDLLKNICIMAVVLLILFFIAGNLPEVIFSTPKNGASILSMIILISPLISFYCMPLINYFSRKAEYNADRFGSSLSSKNELSSALIKLINENKAFPYSHKAHIFFYMSHPPLLERLKALDYTLKPQDDNT